MKRVIMQSEYFNALYEDGVLAKSGKPSYLDAETMANLYEDAEVYFVPQAVYDEHLNGDDYPRLLSDFPLNECERLR